MTRLIDADNLPNIYTATHQEMIMAFEEAPTVDAIPVSWLTAQAENPSNSDSLRNAIDHIVYTMWAERKEE